jgi:hypothetical protein
MLNILGQIAKFLSLVTAPVQEKALSEKILGFARARVCVR